MSSGHQVDVIDVCKKKVGGCIACEHCHTEGKGECIQKDDMQEIYELLKKAEMLVLASPIYYHGMSGQLKCVIDRFYAVAYPVKPAGLKKVAMILSSGNADMYDGALFSFKGDFLDFLGLEDMGVFTAHGEENGSCLLYTSQQCGNGGCRPTLFCLIRRWMNTCLISNSWDISQSCRKVRRRICSR